MEREKADLARVKAVSAKKIADAKTAAYEAPKSREDHPCDTAYSLERKAAADINLGRMQITCDTAVSGLHYAEICDNA